MGSSRSNTKDKREPALCKNADKLFGLPCKIELSRSYHL